MLRWLRRRWRRWLPVGCLAAVVIINLLASGGAGSEGARDEGGDAGLKQPVIGDVSPLAANMGFRKRLQAYPEKDSPGSPNSLESVKNSAGPDGQRSLPDPVIGHHGSPSQHGQQGNQETPPRFKIFVYDLPLRFNTNLTSCSQAHSDGCYKFDHFGMGPELRRHDYLSYRDTHQLSSEIIIHEKMLRSRHRTLDAEKADAFYVPFYAALACTCKVNSEMDISELYEDLWRYLRSTSPYFGSSGAPRRPHLMALGKIEREFWTSNCPLLRDTERTGGITFIGVEEEVNEELRKYFKRTNKRMVVAPYPSYGHFDSSYTSSLGVQNQAGFPSDIRKTTRDVRMFMAVGSRKGHDVRVILKRHMTGTSQRYATFTASSSKQRRYAVWYSTPECRRDMQLPVVDWMRHSVFCLQPPGDSLTRKSFYDAVMAGCIPVTFRPKKRSASVTYPFQDRLDYTRFTVNIPLDDVLSGAVRVVDRLRIIPESRIADMQRRLAEAAPKLQYSYPPTSEDGDAFSMIVEEMLRIAA
ncbi:probable xyloglucan galactosyltransferase GT15 [Patiria miniata]|uniref:Exostosin GT47 domain-containing protein n=1 Tax=Patiria miniata TaxID=46514 RepID=A0A914BLT8_PATMI|nr:probable xyloglucan galactosyltransferase GT15 [Patiria miniata]XP_038076423.1 probable xyloglucan galactosyltransferase GT15 [Patiria miniata]XP_038076432.1 probable xyloglucan galactosyltransferase GT15 [Patiria miniata]